MLTSLNTVYSIFVLYTAYETSPGPYWSPCNIHPCTYLQCEIFVWQVRSPGIIYNT